VKYGALGDVNFFDWLEANGDKVLSADRTALTHAISTSVEAKARIVAADERESGVRALLNLGHTFGHALEAAFGFSEKLLHGEAVAAGMGLAFDYSASEGICASADADRLKAHLKKAGLPAGIIDIDGADAFSAETLLDLMKQDKKVVGGKLTLILARRIGEAFIKEDADLDRLRTFLKAAGAR
jgi:3-dehydroquinate synthase